MSIRPAPGFISTRRLTYEEAIGILFHDARFDSRAPRSKDPESRLERMRAVLAALDNPQDRFRTVHVTGTKGKGSTSAYTESILRHLGYRTGLFTSPHLHTFRERMRVDGQLISQGKCAELIQRALPYLEETPDLTVFGRITVIAFLYFAEAGVNWAVVEVGIGGRLDSTNVVLPEVCGITHISKDHMHILGDSLEEIAAEKAGIIKHRTPVFSAPQKQKAKEVLQRVAEDMEAPLSEVQHYRRSNLPLVGEHQQINAGIAYEMVRELRRAGLVRWDDQLVDSGLVQTRWPCRIEWMPQQDAGGKPMVVDCAHNRDSLEILLSTLAATHAGRPFTFVFGVNSDKDIAPMLKLAASASPRIVLVQSRHPKALPVRELRAAIGSLPVDEGRMVVAAPSMDAAIETAQEITPADGYIVGTGSVFVAAELREAWNRVYPGLLPADDWIHEADTDPPLAPLPPGYGTI
ncbi:MAG: Mur ligase family protein [Caldilineaceae bacterium]|nr:Mur ligase family protein [Caldilineaceae bacterium]